MMMCGTRCERWSSRTASARDLKSVILTPERSLESVSGLLRHRRIACSRDILGFELVGQDEIGILQQVLVCRDYFFADIDLALVTHDRVEHCVVQLRCMIGILLFDLPQKKAPGFVVHANLVSRAILPTCSTTPALGQ